MTNPNIVGGCMCGPVIHGSGPCPQCGMGGPEIQIFSAEDADTLGKLAQDALGELAGLVTMLEAAAVRLGRQREVSGIVGLVRTNILRMAQLLAGMRAGNLEAVRVFRTIYNASFIGIHDVLREYGADIYDRPFFQEEFEFWEKTLLGTKEEPGLIPRLLPKAAGFVAVLIAGVVVLVAVLRRR